MAISDFSDEQLKNLEDNYREAAKIEGGIFSLSDVLLEKWKRGTGGFNEMEVARKIISLAINNDDGLLTYDDIWKALKTQSSQNPKEARLALKIYNAIINTWGSSQEPRIYGIVTKTLEDKIDLLPELHQAGDKHLLSSVPKLYDILIQRFYNSGDKTRAGQAVLSKAEFFHDHREYDIAVQLREKVFELFSSSHDPEIIKLVEQAYDEQLSFLSDIESDEMLPVQTAYAKFALGNKLDRSVIDVVFNACENLEEANKYDEAFSIYEALINKINETGSSNYAEDRLSALLNKGICLRCLGRTEEAIHVFTDVLIGAKTEYDWDVATALLELGASFSAIGRNAHAIVLYDAVTERFKEKNEMESFVVMALLAKAKMFQVMIDPAGAITICNLIIQRPKNEQTSATITEALFVKAQLLKVLCEYSQAITIYEFLIQEHGNSTAIHDRRNVGDAMLEKARCLNSEGLTDESLECFDRILELFANDTDTDLVRVVNQASRAWNDISERLSRNK